MHVPPFGTVFLMPPGWRLHSAWAPPSLLAAIFVVLFLNLASGYENMNVHLF